MGSIVSTTVGEDGSYTYSDAQGNTCTLDADGNMTMTGKDGSTVSRDHTIYQSPSALATELTGYSLTRHSGRDYGLMNILISFPESVELMDIKQKKETSTQEESFAFSFQKEICVYTKITTTETYTSNTILGKEYTARDGYFDSQLMGKMHLKVTENGKVSLYSTSYNEKTKRWEDREPVMQVNGSAEFSNSYFEFASLPDLSQKKTVTVSTSEYFNYRILDNGNAKLTNMTKEMVLNKWDTGIGMILYTDKDGNTFNVNLTPEPGGDDDLGEVSPNRP